MLYRQVIHFEPIEDIIQLLEAEDENVARQHVRTYVISDHMATNLLHVVLPQLQFDHPANNKGLLIVGNYGTGKSHLMSVLAAVAEFPDLYQYVRHPEVSAALQQVSGKFKVWRTEVGGVTGSLRDILLGELEEALETWGAPYHFPPADTLANHKDVLVEAVAGLQQKHPGQGLLLVVDELLDYLRTREERELILDLGFLRELGEVAALTPFRFMAGLQETLFDNPRFNFVSEQLRRVKDRFEQVRIAREDIAYVVSERLLGKDDAQKAQVREHLARFQPLYPGLAERMDEFVRMFPVHPAYIEVIEDVRVVEKRQVLKILSEAMQRMQDQPVPGDAPGLLSFDHYWQVLRDNPSLRSLPEIAEVVDKSTVLENRIAHTFSRKHLLPAAQRIIHALSLHRLTTDDIHVPLGMTAEELRDTLFLSIPLPEPAADLLLDQVRVALKEIMRAVSGQYISENDANGQFYLDVKKDIDFEAKIQERGDFVSEADLSRYFFDALRQALGLSTSTYVSGARIWFHELPWLDHKITRPGYFIFGPPDERTTAQPPRDFYVYFLSPFEQRQWHDERLADEVIFHLKGVNEDLRGIVRRYAGAQMLASDSPNHRQAYLDKAAETRDRLLLPWLREHLLESLHVTHQGVEKPIRAVLPALPSTESPQPVDLLNRAATYLLTPAFVERYPDYPRFDKAQQPITENARPTAAMEALRGILGGRPTRLGETVLRGLGLLDAEGFLRPQDSPYAAHLLQLLHARPDSQVVPRGEVLEKVADSVAGTLYKDLRFHLEPEWVAVLLAALIYHGEIVLTLPGNKTLGADVLEQYSLVGPDELTGFLHYARPKKLPLGTWKEIFGVLGLAPGLIQDESKRAQAVEELQKKVQAQIQAIAPLEIRLQNLRLWNESLFTDQVAFTSESGIVVGSNAPAGAISMTDFKVALRGYKRVLEDLTHINTVGKLANLKISPADLADLRPWQQNVVRAQTLLDAVSDLYPLTEYLSSAGAYLPPEHAWQESASALRRRTLETLRHLALGETTTTAVITLRQDLEALKKSYITAYAEQHRRLALGPSEDARRQKLYVDPRLIALKSLSTVDLLRENAEQLRAWENATIELRVCPEFHEGVLESSPYCPHCKVNPAAMSTDLAAGVRLSQLDERLTTLLGQWTQALRAALESPQAQASLQAMAPSERQPVTTFLAQIAEAPTLPENFVESANHALRGIQAVRLATATLVEKLQEGGLPCTVDEFRARFNRFVQQALHGRDESNTRLTLDV